MTTVYKRWSDNERLYAADLNNLADQAIPYFATTAARDAAIATPVAGQLCYVAAPATNPTVYVYQGGRWVSVTQYSSQGVGHLTALPLSATAADHVRHPVPYGLGSGNVWLEVYNTQFFVSGGTALSASHKWVGDLHKVDSGASPTTVATVTIDSGASSAWREFTVTVAATLARASFFTLALTWTKTGTPGNLYYYDQLLYRTTE